MLGSAHCRLSPIWKRQGPERSTVPFPRPSIVTMEGAGEVCACAKRRGKPRSISTRGKVTSLQQMRIWRALYDRRVGGQTGLRPRFIAVGDCGEAPRCRTRFAGQRNRGAMRFEVSKNISKGSPLTPQISPLRCAPVEMTKGRAALPGTMVAERSQFSSTWVVGRFFQARTANRRSLHFAALRSR
jgi:hypothetical protein